MNLHLHLQVNVILLNIIPIIQIVIIEILLKIHFLKLDVKFYFPMSNGEVNVEMIKNWIKQIELY